MMLLISLISWHFKDYITFYKIGTAAFLISTVVFTFRKSKINSKELLTQKVPILIYDYQIKDNVLSFLYWNENGANKKETRFKINKLDSANIKLNNNQIYYNKKQLTFDNSNKLKPILANKNQILFLSDANRGIGFYELKVININK